ncbi:MAG TPA: T9SS type A sorting domain-containing protein, partial [Bacteroidia bacterium]|nr:T9SS type A sorting domain-containing protein [Bacteroidia bacterium]
SGEMLEDHAQLAWDTRSEQGTRHFVVERSIADVAHFEAIGTVTATGGTTSPAQYQFSDPNASKTQLNYYRIQEVDQNGAGGYSNTIELHSESLLNELKVTVHPNPVAAGEDLMLSIHSTKAQAIMAEVVDLNGRKVAESALEVNVGEGLHRLNIGAAAPGWYVVRLTGSGVRVHAKVMVAANAR